MRFKLKVFIFLILFILSFIIISKPLILFFVKNNLSNFFKTNKIFIGDLKIKLPNSIYFYDIEIRNKEYLFKIKEVSLFFDLNSIIKKRFKKIGLKNASIKINSKNLDLFKRTDYKTKDGIFFDFLSLSNIYFDIKTNNFSSVGSFSLELNSSGLVSLLRAEVDSFKIFDFSLYKCFININDSCGNFLIKQANYRDVKLKELNSNLVFKENKLVFDNLGGFLFDGRISGEFNIDFYKRFLDLNLNFLNLNIERLISDFKLDKDLCVSGIWKGSLNIIVDNSELKKFDGNFKSINYGGVLSINNKKFLENLSKSTNLTYEILVERFRDYRYNIGNIDIYLKDKDLIFKLYLFGDKGKSDLLINIYNFQDMLFKNITGGKNG